MGEQLRTPLYDAILKYIDEETAPLHIPSHKMGAAIDSRWKEFVGENIFKMDLTEVTGLDDLHQPSVHSRKPRIWLQKHGGLSKATL